MAESKVAKRDVHIANGGNLMFVVGAIQTESGDDWAEIAITATLQALIGDRWLPVLDVHTTALATGSCWRLHTFVDEKALRAAVLRQPEWNAKISIDTWRHLMVAMHEAAGAAVVTEGWT